MRLAPGDPVRMMVNAEYMAGGAEEFIARRRAELGLDKPLPVQYVAWLDEVARGNLGYSYFEACRIVRGLALSPCEQDFLIAARAMGASQRRIILRHLVPAVLSPLHVTATFAVAQAILSEAALSFLGLGVRPPQPSRGNMLNEAQSLTILESMPWLWVPPGVAIAVTVLAINFIGDGLRDALDPRQRI